MCGIAGVVGVPVDPQIARRMCDLQKHRGPDGEGFWEDRSAAVFLGHRRLAIIDLAAGAQPMTDADESVVVTYNGEIYNHLAIRRELESRGHRFRTQCDTEVLVHGYKEWNESLVERLNGIYAFALWDRRRGRLMLARDRLGVKPLYVARLSGGGIAFASEAKAFVSSGLIPARLDEESLPVHLALRYVPAPRTLFAGVEKLPPGYIGVWSAGGRWDTRPYWNLEVREDLRLTPDRASDELRSRLKEAVRGQLMSDVPLGVFLSGGVDSSAIAALAAQERKDPVDTFFIDFGESGFSEGSYAREASAFIRTRHHETRLDLKGYLDFLEEIVWYQDEPIADPAAVPLYFVAKLARDNGHIVLLSGEGADETLAGYAYGKFPLYKKLSFLFDLFPSALLARLNYFGWNALRTLAIIREVLEVHSQTLPFLPQERLRLNPAFESSPDPWDLLRTVDRRIPREASNLGRMLYVDTKTWLPEDILLKADKMTMATSVELRVPFLDHTLVEWAFRLAASLKHRNGEGKWILKQAMRGLVPDRILYRKKQGFPVPFSRWIRENPAMGDELTAPDNPLTSTGRLRRAAVESLVRLHRTSGVDLGYGLMTLLFLSRWMRRFGVS